jgi:hypothetical protein
LQGLIFALFCGPDGRVCPNSSKHNQINRDRESFPMSAAERFYGRALKVQPQVRPSDEMQKELAQPRHRYYCVHQYLQAHPDLTVVELGFGEPEIAAALAQICRSYRIVDVVDRRRNATLPDNVRNVSTTLRQPAFEFKLGLPAFGLAG